MMKQPVTAGHKLFSITLILAPLLLFISSFFWKNGEYGVTVGTILILSTGNKN